MSESEHGFGDSRRASAGKRSGAEKTARTLSRLMLPAFHLVHLLRRPMTLGVRCALFDGEGRVFLVRHTYTPGWYLPGGGVDPGETSAEAVRRELLEEGEIELLEEPRLVSVHFNDRASRRDHVLLYRAGAWLSRGAKAPDREIAETGFFPPAALPDGATAATRARLTEIAGTAPASPRW